MVPSDPTPGPDGERDVFGSLPNTRPQRRSAKRDRARGTAKAATPTKTAAPRRKPARATAARTKAKPQQASATTASKIPPAGYATPRPDDDGVPRGAHLLTTLVQAAGELAHIGLSAAGRALKSALGRLPRP